MSAPQNQPGLIRRTVRNPDESIQSWAVGPPQAAAAFNPANGFPWNTPDEAYQPQCWPDPTTDIVNAFGPPLNATQAQAWNTPDADPASYFPVTDESVQSWAIQPPLNATQAQEWNTPDEVQYAPVPDETSPAWAVGPPQNAVTAQAFNQPDDATFGGTADDTAQPWAIQPPAAAAFDPAAGFPWNQDGGERFVQSQLIDDPTSYGFGQPPLNAVIAQAWNVPDEGAYQPTLDDTAQALAIQPPAAAAFDPAGGFPWPVDDVVITWPTYALDPTQPSWAVQPPAAAFDPSTGFPWNTADEGGYQRTVDDSAQPWAIVVPSAPFDPSTGFPFNDYGPEPALPAWLIDRDFLASSWAATLPSVVTGIVGFTPGGVVPSQPPAGFAPIESPNGDVHDQLSAPGGAVGPGAPGGGVKN